MNEDIIVLLIIFGSGVAIVTIAILGSLIKAWINQKGSSFDEEAFDRLARTFIKHKKDSERRIQKLEAAILGEGSEKREASLKDKLDKSKEHHTLEIDTKTQKGEAKEQSGNLRNMLKE